MFLAHVALRLRRGRYHSNRSIRNSSCYREGGVMWILIGWFASGRVHYYGPFQTRAAAAAFDRSYVQKLPGLAGDTTIQPVIHPGIAGP